MRRLPGLSRVRSHGKVRKFARQCSTEARWTVVKFFSHCGGIEMSFWDGGPNPDGIGKEVLKFVELLYKN